MTTTLTPANAHLQAHRRLVVTRAVTVGLAGIVPVPMLDEWLVAGVKRGTIRRLADLRRVDLDEGAVRAIAQGDGPAPSWRTILGSTLVGRLLRGGFRRLLVVVAIVRRADDAARAFAEATLFDHYCARLHVGGELDEAAGRRVRAAIDRAIAATSLGVGARLFRRGLTASARAAVRAPFQVTDALVGGVVRRLRGRREEVEAEEVVEEAFVSAGDRSSGLVVRATRAVERQLAGVGRDYVDGLVAAFEEAWRTGAGVRGA